MVARPGCSLRAQAELCAARRRYRADAKRGQSVDEAWAPVEHDPVPKSATARPALSAILSVALAAASSPAFADPLYSSAGTPAPAAAAWTQVHIVTPAPGVVLERRLGSLPGDPAQLPRGPYSDGEPQWKPVCTAPCDTAVQLGGDYRIAGEGVTSSSSFALHGPTTQLRVAAGSHGLRRAGSYLAVIGFIGAIAGGIFLGVSAIHPAGQPSSGLGAGGYASIAGLAVGGTIGVVGVGMVIGGGTSVQDEGRHDLAHLAPPSALHATFRF
jgi:hypothetical protein